MAYADANPNQANDWFAAKLRIDKATLRRANEENPLFGPTDPNKVDLSISPALRAAAARFAEGAFKAGIISVKIDPESLFR